MSNEDFAGYWYLLKGSYDKGVHAVRHILECQTEAEEFVTNQAAMTVVFGFDEEHMCSNDQEILDIIVQSPYIDTALYTYLKGSRETISNPSQADFQNIFSTKILQRISDNRMLQRAFTSNSLNAFLTCASNYEYKIRWQPEFSNMDNLSKLAKVIESPSMASSTQRYDEDHNSNLSIRKRRYDSLSYYMFDEFLNKEIAISPDHNPEIKAYIVGAPISHPSYDLDGYDGDLGYTLFTLILDAGYAQHIDAKYPLISEYKPFGEFIEEQLTTYENLNSSYYVDLKEAIATKGAKRIRYAYTRPLYDSTMQEALDSTSFAIDVVQRDGVYFFAHNGIGMHTNISAEKSFPMKDDNKVVEPSGVSVVKKPLWRSEAEKTICDNIAIRSTSSTKELVGIEPFILQNINNSYVGYQRSIVIAKSGTEMLYKHINVQPMANAIKPVAGWFFCI